MSRLNNSPNTVRGNKRVVYPVTHNGRTIGTIDVPKNLQVKPEEYAFVKRLLLMCEKVNANVKAIEIGDASIRQAEGIQAETKVGRRNVQAVKRGTAKLSKLRRL